MLAPLGCQGFRAELRLFGGNEDRAGAVLIDP